MSDIAGLMSFVAANLLLYWLVKKNGWRCPDKATRILGFVFLAASVVLLSISTMAAFQTYFRGYWTTRIMIWIWILTGSVYFIFGRRTSMTAVGIIGSGISFFLFPVLAAVFIIPSYLILMSISVWDNMTGQGGRIYLEDAEFRIESFEYGGESSKPANFIFYRKNGLFETRDGEFTTGQNFSGKITVQKSPKLYSIYMDNRAGAPDSVHVDR